MSFRSIAQMMRAFSLATVTTVRLIPRRSRNALIHRLSALVLPAATRKTDLAPVNQQGSQVLIAALTYAHQCLSVPIGMLPWDETHPGSQMPTVFELGTVSDSRNHWHCGIGTYATNACDTLTGIIGPEDCFNAAVESLDPHIHLAKDLVKFGNDVACHAREAVGLIGKTVRYEAPGPAKGDTYGAPRSKSRPRIWLTRAVRWLTSRVRAR